MKFKPTLDRVLVRPIKQDDTKMGSHILVPKSVNTQLGNMGEVLAAGPGVSDKEIVGKTIIFNTAGAAQVNDKDLETLYLVKEEEIYACVEGEVSA